MMKIDYIAKILPNSSRTIDAIKTARVLKKCEIDTLKIPSKMAENPYTEIVKRVGKLRCILEPYYSTNFSAQ